MSEQKNQPWKNLDRKSLYASKASSSVAEVFWKKINPEIRPQKNPLARQVGDQFFKNSPRGWFWKVRMTMASLGLGAPPLPPFPSLRGAFALFCKIMYYCLQIRNKPSFIKYISLLFSYLYCTLSRYGYEKKKHGTPPWPTSEKTEKTAQFIKIVQISRAGYKEKKEEEKHQPVWNRGYIEKTNRNIKF